MQYYAKIRIILYYLDIITEKELFVDKMYKNSKFHNLEFNYCPCIDKSSCEVVGYSKIVIADVFYPVV